MASPRASSDSSFVVRIPRNTFKIAGIAFLVGIALFLAVWQHARKQGFYKADNKPAVVESDGQDIPPLPEPLPRGAETADMPQPKPAGANDDNAAELVEPSQPQPLAESPATASAPLAANDDTQPAAPAPAATPATATATPLASGDQPEPIEGETPAPRYPPDALRRGDSGTVVVRVDVDTAGNTTGVTLIQSSNSRDLDRAAISAVRRWRFRPAQRDGTAVASSVDVPFDFNPR